MRAIASLFITVCIGSSAVAQAAAPAACHATSPATRATVIELYTSEGCSSCPPADRWAASLPDTPQRVLLAFHVDYWDRLGWKDRFASPVYTERQQALRLPSGGRFAYTPQVLVDGADWKRWPALPSAGGQAAPVRIELQREGAQVLARVSAAEGGAGPLQRFSGYWAVVEDGHRSQVQAGENAGATLRHDHVVRRYEPVATWPAAQPKEWRWETAAQDTGAAATAGTPPAARRTVFVVTDPLTQRPLQAAWLGC
jgi:hypothetical protein